LIEDDDQITHELDLLDENVKGDEILNIFKAKPPQEYADEDLKWSKVSKQILGDDVENVDVSSEDSEAEEQNEVSNERDTVRIIDYTEQDMVNLRKTIYLCIQSSINFEECVHKLLKLNIKEGQEAEVVTMLIDCSAMERTFQKFFALQGERLCRLNPLYQQSFLDCFKKQYETVHRLETNKLRNTSKFFAHLLYTDALPWSCLDVIRLTEETTTSSSRIFIKIVFQELSEHMGLTTLNKRLHEPGLQPFIAGIFPQDHPKNIRFSINFFTAIGLGGLTDDLRAMLANAQTRFISGQAQDKHSEEERSSSSSSSSSSSDSSGSSDDDSD